MDIFRWPLFILWIILFLAGCGSPYTFGPTKYGSSDHLEYRDNTRGGLMGDGAFTLLDRGTESILVGWEHFDDGNRIHNHIYRGAVKFNVNLLNEPPSKTITKATLRYTVETGANSSDIFITSCAKQLLIANSSWQGIPEVDIDKADDTIPGHFIAELPDSLLGSKVSIDVTEIVKNWVSGKVPNHGFVFSALKEQKGIIPNNEKCWTILGSLTLQVNYIK